MGVLEYVFCMFSKLIQSLENYFAQVLEHMHLLLILFWKVKIIHLRRVAKTLAWDSCMAGDLIVGDIIIIENLEEICFHD